MWQRHVLLHNWNYDRTLWRKMLKSQIYKIVTRYFKKEFDCPVHLTHISKEFECEKGDHNCTVINISELPNIFEWVGSVPHNKRVAFPQKPFLNTNLGVTNEFAVETRILLKEVRYRSGRRFACTNKDYFAENVVSSSEKTLFQIPVRQDVRRCVIPSTLRRNSLTKTLRYRVRHGYLLI